MAVRASCWIAIAGLALGCAGEPGGRGREAGETTADAAGQPGERDRAEPTAATAPGGTAAEPRAPDAPADPRTATGTPSSRAPDGPEGEREACTDLELPDGAAAATEVEAVLSVSDWGAVRASRPLDNRLAVAIDGDTLAVGAPHGDLALGAVHVLARSDDGWALQATIAPPDGARSSMFGQTVALSGDTLAVGAPDPPLHGSVYVFVRSGSSWTLQATLSADPPTDDDSFGFSLALQGDTLLASSQGPEGDGAVDAFVREADGWTHTQTLTAIDGKLDSGLGTSLALAGDRLAVGALWDDDADGTSTGSVHVFVRDGAQWVPDAILTGDATRDNQYFGFSVALAGDVLVVGDPSQGSKTYEQAPAVPPPAPGSATVFERHCDSGWTETAFLKASLPESTSSLGFGSSVAIAGPLMLVGFDEDPYTAAGIIDGVISQGTLDSTFTGSVYAFVRRNGVFEQTDYLKPTQSPVHFKRFGYQIAMDGDRFVVAAPGQDTVYVFR